MNTTTTTIFDFNNSDITDKDLESLGDVHAINLSRCHQITNKSLEYLSAVHTIDISFCDQNQGLEYLQAVQTINFFNN